MSDNIGEAGDDGDDSDDGEGWSSGEDVRPGQKRVNSTEMASILGAPWDDKICEFVESSKKTCDAKAEKFEGTCPRASFAPSGITSVPFIAKVLTNGLCEKSSDGLEILNGVYFKPSKLESLKSCYDTPYMFNPENIGVVLGTTEVRIDDKVHVVKSFDHGSYIVGDRGLKITQWELLQNRCDQSVTLESDLRRFILHLVSTYTVMMAHVVPFISGGSNVTTGMIWNVHDAVARANMDGRIDPESEMTITKLIRIKNRVETLRDLSLNIFTSAAVEDTVPATFWPVYESEHLRKFAQTSGSLKELNFLGWLGCAANHNRVSGYLFTGDVVRGGFSEAPPAYSRGCWEEKLKNVIKLLTCAYRLGCPVNLVEAYHPLSLNECRILQDHHHRWQTNLADSLCGLHLRDTRSSDATDAELEGEKSYALRFARARSTAFNPIISPVTVLGCGIRDTEKDGSLALHSLDTSYFSYARVAPFLLERVLGNDSCVNAVQRILGTSEQLFQNARNLRDKTAAKTNGAIGDSAKIRKMRAVLVEQTSEEREETMGIFMEAMSNNGCRRLMEAIERIDPGFVEWGLGCLEEAKQVSTTYKRVDTHGEDHLLGNTPGKIIEGKGRVAALLKQLDAEGFTCKDISVFSVATALASMFNAACLRPQDFFNLLAKTLYYNKKLHRLMIGLPDAGKQTKAAEKQLARACMEHCVEGSEVVRWWVVMSLVGRPFLKKHNDGWVDPRFGPMGTNGKVLSEKVFRTIFAQMGRLFFATGNADVNALRTVQDTLAVEHIIELGMTTDAICITELAREQRTSKEVRL